LCCGPNKLVVSCGCYINITERKPVSRHLKLKMPEAIVHDGRWRTGRTRSPPILENSEHIIIPVTHTMRDYKSHEVPVEGD
jgi:hypothetical protein